MSCASGNCGGVSNRMSGGSNSDHDHATRAYLSGADAGVYAGNCHGPPLHRAPTLYSDEHEMAKEERYMSWLRNRLGFQASIPRGYCCPAQCVGSNTSNCSPCQTQSVPAFYGTL